MDNTNNLPIEDSAISITHGGAQYCLGFDNGKPFLMGRPWNADGTMDTDWGEVDFWGIDEPLADILRCLERRLLSLHEVWQTMEAEHNLAEAHARMNAVFDASNEVDNPHTEVPHWEPTNKENTFRIFGFASDYIPVAVDGFLVACEYNNNKRRALTIESNSHEPLMTITVNLDTPPPAGCLWIKDWSENEGIIEGLKDCEVIIGDAPEAYKPSGHVVVGAWRINPDLYNLFK